MCFGATLRIWGCDGDGLRRVVSLSLVTGFLVTGWAATGKCQYCLDWVLTVLILA